MAAKNLKNKNGIFAAVGAATGLGNAFRFPALCLNHGAAFIFTYAVALAVVCFPLLAAELHFGRRRPRGKSAKIWEIIMCAATLNSAFIALYYGVIAARLGSESLSFALLPLYNGGNTVLFISALFIVLGTVYALFKGAPRSLARSGKLSVSLSVVLFSCLAVAGIVRGGAFSSFNFSALKSYSIWSDALGQALLALSLAAGVMPSYAKNLPNPFSAVNSALKITLANFVFCILTTLSILPFFNQIGETVGIICAINAYTQVVFSLFSSAAGARIFGFVLFAVLTVIAIHSLASLAYPALSRLSHIKCAPLVFCLLSACLAPLFTFKNLLVLSVCDKLACSYFAVAIAVCECLFFASQRDIVGVIALKLPLLRKIKRQKDSSAAKFRKGKFLQ